MTDLKDQILSRINFESYYSDKVNFTEKKGNNWQAKCPFHSEKSGSFYVEINTGRWFCQGACQTGGDIFRFHERFFNVEFKEALKQLAESVGLEVPKHEDRKKKETRGRKANLSEEKIEKHHEELCDEDRAYLNSRKISDEVINKYKIGNAKKGGDRVIVIPVRKNGRLHNLRFYNRNKTEGKVSQLSKKQLGHDPIWIFPEPDPEQDSVFLFEGEPDTLCALSLGLNACSYTGGAGTFREESLKFFKKKKVFVCYDIDEAGRKGARLLGRLIASVADEVRIVKLDLDPKKHPKGDFNDYIAKEGKTKEDFLKLANAGDVVPVIEEGIDVSVVEDNGMYFNVKQTKDGAVFTRISNFTIKLLCRYKVEDEDGDGWEVLREIIMVGQNGQSDSAFLTPKSLSTVANFKKFCVGRGKFVFEGTGKDIDGIIHLIEAQDKHSKLVREVYQVGESRENDLWLFDKIAIKNGEMIRPDERGVFWNGSEGYRLARFTLGESAARGPDLIIPDEGDRVENFIPQLCESLVENLGGNYDALLGVALATGSIYFKDFVLNNRLACYPIVFIYGTLKSGKTEFASFLMRMFGMGRADSESMPALTSTVPISRRLSYFSNVPIWIDEYRDNLPKSGHICGVLRSAYDGTGRSLGRKGFGVHRNDVRSSVIVSGEHLPSDEAFISRLVPIQMNISKRNENFHRDVLKYSYRSSEYLFHLMRTKTEKKAEELFESAEEYIKILKGNYPSIDSRTIKNYAIALACYRVLANPDDDILEQYITKVGINALGLDDVREEGEESYLTEDLKEFFEIIQNLIENETIKKEGWGRVINEGGVSSVFIHMSTLYDAYSRHYRMSRGIQPASLKTVASWMKTLRCYKRSGVVQRMRTMENELTGSKKCIELDIRTLPRSIQSVFAALPEVTGEILPDSNYDLF